MDCSTSGANIVIINSSCGVVASTMGVVAHIVSACIVVITNKWRCLAAIFKVTAVNHATVAVIAVDWLVHTPRSA